MSAASSIRARVRAEMLEEIKAVARRHLATDGANLSLRAVARDMGMVSSAVYRYVASRDELLTALIIDAYDALGAAAEAAEAAVPRDDPRARWFAVCDAVRAWARAQPAEYALIYGTPVPGYAAPGDTVGPASRPTMVLIALLADALDSGALRPDAGDGLPATVRGELAHLAAHAGANVPPGTLSRGFTAWIQLFGLLSFEIFGRFQDTVTDLDGYFAYQMGLMADVLGLP